MINGVLSFLMGVIVFFKNSRQWLNRFFALYCLGGAVWGIFYGFWHAAKNGSDALLFAKILATGAMVFGFFFADIT